MVEGHPFFLRVVTRSGLEAQLTDVNLHKSEEGQQPHQQVCQECQHLPPLPPQSCCDNGCPAVSTTSINTIQLSTKRSEVQGMLLIVSAVLLTHMSQVSDFVLHSSCNLLQSVAQLHLLGCAVLLQHCDDLMAKRMYH